MQFRWVQITFRKLGGIFVINFVRKRTHTFCFGNNKFWSIVILPEKKPPGRRTSFNRRSKLQLIGQVLAILKKSHQKSFRPKIVAIFFLLLISLLVCFYFIYILVEWHTHTMHVIDSSHWIDKHFFVNRIIIISVNKIDNFWWIK